jgi:hypothetical protein
MGEGGVNVLALMDSAARKSLFEYSSGDMAIARQAVIGLIEAAQVILEATGKSSASWPLSDPKRIARAELDSALRIVVSADPYNGTTGDAVTAALLAARGRS